MASVKHVSGRLNGNKLSALLNKTFPGAYCKFGMEGQQGWYGVFPIGNGLTVFLGANWVSTAKIIEGLALGKPLNSSFVKRIYDKTTNTF